MRHIGRLGGIDQNFTVRAHDHSLRLDADLYRSNERAPLNVDDRHRVVVLIGNVKELAVGSRGEKFWIRAGRQRASDRIGLRVNQLYRVVVAARDHDVFLILGVGDAARPLTDLDRLSHFPAIGIDFRNGIALFVGNVRGEGFGAVRKQHGKTDSEYKAEPHSSNLLGSYLSWHLVSGRSNPNVSSSEF